MLGHSDHKSHGKENLHFGYQVLGSDGIERELQKTDPLVLRLQGELAGFKGTLRFVILQSDLESYLFRVDCISTPSARHGGRPSQSKPPVGSVAAVSQPLLPRSGPGPAGQTLNIM